MVLSDFFEATSYLINRKKAASGKDSVGAPLQKSNKSGLSERVTMQTFCPAMAYAHL